MSNEVDVTKEEAIESGLDVLEDLRRQKKESEEIAETASQQAAEIEVKIVELKAALRKFGVDVDGPQREDSI